MDPLLGFGVFSTVVTATEAAKSIVTGVDYESGIQSTVKFNMKFWEYRKAFNLLDNRGYDLLIGLIRLPGVNSLIYRSNKINVVTIGYSALKPFNALMKYIH